MDDPLDRALSQVTTAKTTTIQNVAELAIAVYSLVGLARQKESNIKTLEGNNKSLADRIAELQDENRKLELKNQETLQALENTSSTFRALDKQIDQLKAARELLTERNNDQAVVNANQAELIKGLREEASALIKHNFELTREVEKLTRQNAELSHSLDLVRDQNDVLTQKNEALTTENEDLRAALPAEEVAAMSKKRREESKYWFGKYDELAHTFVDTQAQAEVWKHRAEKLQATLDAIADAMKPVVE